MKHTSLLAALLLAAASLGLAGEASATTYCNIGPTKDGFVALRAGPSASSRLIAKMRVGDEIQAHSESKGKWMKATWYKGGRFKGGGPTYDPSNGVGWVYSPLITEDCG